jgi:hypothetical protein
MTKRILSLVVIALLGCGVAAAQATRTWVSGVGDDVNPCSRTAPCKTFAGAISKTAAGGEIDALDPAGYGALTITKSITIDGGGGQVASILASGTTGIFVNAGSGDVVTLRNLRINGAGGGASANGINGIDYIAGGKLMVENVDVFGFTQNGIRQRSTSNGLLVVRNTTVTNVGGAGIRVESGRASIEGSNLSGNNYGLILYVGKLTAVKTVAAQNSLGFLAGSGEMNLTDCAAINNNGTGITANGGGIIRIAHTTITGNVTGISSAGGQVISWGNNFNDANGTDGAPSSTIAQQ